MILQKADPQTNIIAWLIDRIPFAVGFIFVNLFFTFTIYLAAKIINLKDKSDFIEERNFFFRTFLMVLVLSVIIVALMFIFVVMLFSPLFEEIPIGILLNVMNTRIWGIVETIGDSPVGAQIIMAIILFVIVLVIALIASDTYGVSFPLAIGVILIAVGLYLAIDLTIMFTINPEGVAGLITLLGNTIRDLAWLGAFQEAYPY